MKSLRRPLRGAVGAIGLGGLLATSLVFNADASSHREAPLITEDPVADNTDTYAFVSPDRAQTVTLIANWVPLEEPAGGPNFHGFGDDVLYEINVDNDGDAVDDITYEFRFTTEIKNPDTFLYNTLPIEPVKNSLGRITDYQNLNVQQRYTVHQVRDGVRRMIGQNLLVPPTNVGPRSTPDYADLWEGAIYTLSGGIKVFAGPRDDPFFVDLGSIFDLGGLRTLNEAHLIPLPNEPGVDGVSGFNTHTIAMQVPKRLLVEDDPVIGVYSTTYRRANRIISEDGTQLHTGPWVQVSRLGMPLVNEVVIPLGDKDRFNASEPIDDAQFLNYVQDPELARLIEVLYPGVEVPDAPRDDIVAVFLTGVPGLNQPENVVPSEMIRLNTAIAPTPFERQHYLGLLAGTCDLSTGTGDNCDGFPNGRRLIDDVVNIELQALGGVLQGMNTELGLGDNVRANDKPFFTFFPYMAEPHQGYDHLHDHSNQD